jgi:hypothetical protein
LPPRCQEPSAAPWLRVEPSLHVSYSKGKNTWEPAKNLLHAKKVIAKFHKENPAALYSISAALFNELYLLFCPPDIWTNSDLFSDLADLSWELGKYVGLDVLQGCSSLEGR